MRRARLTVPGLLAALALALVPVTALAAHYSETVTGIETGFPQSTPDCPAPWSVSPFAGSATGGVDGFITLAVCHTPLDPGATIEGGIYTITSSQKTLSGRFAGGTVAYLGTTYPAAGFCQQHYAVTGTLRPAGSFTGFLTHYGVVSGSTCSIYFATIAGTAEMTG